MERFETKWVGIEKCKDDDGWYVFDGDIDIPFDKEPTDGEIEVIAEQAIENSYY